MNRHLKQPCRERKHEVKSVHKDR